MTLDEMILVSVDDHAIEPRGAFDRHMPAGFKGRGPVNEHIDGRDVWMFEGRAWGYMGLNSVVGRPKEEYGMEPLSYEHMRAGTYSVTDRVDDMSANGVLASLCFPTFPGFAGQKFQAHPERDVALAAMQAYNDWHVEDWCGAAPGRFIPMIMIPMWDMKATVAEIERHAKNGVHAITFPDNPAKLGFPSIHNEYWEPLWKVCADNKVVINCHIGTGTHAPHASDESPIDAWITSMPISIANSAADWIWAPMWKRYPDLRMALSEGGIAWVPYLMERADFTNSHNEAWTHATFGDEKPSDVFKRHIITCFIEDIYGLKNLDMMNEDMVCWECDYPHSDCTWPNSPESAWESLGHLTREQIDKITHLNTMREYSFDPFKHMKRENATVAALRKQAEHVEILPRPGMGGAAPEGQGQRIVTSGDINRMFAAANAESAL
ncbi:MAG: amidohydrolase family protein [Hyphomonadaceae bacterium]|nr:amidohydrolase family protein [Hyphomonadaceae bacterium]